MAEYFAEKNQEKERKIPVFSVLKNNSILKNIFLTEAPSSNLFEENKNGGIKKHGFEEIFVVGRHPDCNIKLEHPSISRFHLRIHSIPSLQSLSVFDLSSVHGTWVCGKRIEPDVEVKLREGDTLQLGVSSRIYRLHWVPLSGIYDFNNPCLPTIDETEPMEEKEEEEEEEETHKHEGSLWGGHDLSLNLGDETAESERFLSYLVEDGREERHEGENYLCPDDHTETINDGLEVEGIKLMFADMNMALQSKPGTPSSCKLDCTQSPYLSQEEKVVKSSFKMELEDKKNEDVWCPRRDRCLANDDDLEGLSFLFTDMNMITQPYQWTPSEYLMPAHEKLPLSYEEDIFDPSTYLQTVSPSTPLTPEGTKSNINGEQEKGNDNISVGHGGKASLHSANKLHNYCISSATQSPEDAKSPFHNGDEEENNDRLFSESPSSSFKLDCTQSPSLSQEEKVVKSSFKVELEDKKNEDVWSPRRYRSLANDDDLEGLSFLFTDMNMITQSYQWTPSEYLMPAHEKLPLSYEEDKFDPSTYLQTVSPSTPLTPEGTKEKGNDNISVDHGGMIISATPSSEDAKSPFHNGDEEENNNRLFSGTADTQTISEHAKQNICLNDSCASGKSEPKSPCPSPWSRSGKSIWKRGESDSVQIQEKATIGPSSDYFCERENKAEESVFTPDKENCTPDFHLNRSLKKIDQRKLKCEVSIKSLTYSSDGENEEAFTPGKENISPATRLLMSMKKMGMDKVKPKTYRSSPLKNVDTNIHQVVGQSGSSGKGIELRKLLHGMNTARSACRSNKKFEPEANVFKASPDKETPFQFFIVNSGSRNCDASNVDVTTGGCGPMNNPNVNKKPTYHFNAFEEKNKKWTMVVDTACLLDKESRKALQLMQGLPRTNMIIPRMVIKELDFLKRHGSFFRSTKQASAALQWIEDCMVNAQAWIHVQSAMEDKRQIAPTLTASFSCFSVDKMKLLAEFLPFYHWEDPSEIVSPTTEDHILECAIWLRRMGDNGQVVLLSDNISLKIKAMAEGLLCETAEQFRESLVNPFSERFFWTHSSPRGLTWSCVDDVVLKNKYYNGLSKKQSQSGEETKGLKLVLLYNSQFRPISSVN